MTSLYLDTRDGRQPMQKAMDQYFNAFFKDIRISSRLQMKFYFFPYLRDADIPYDSIIWPIRELIQTNERT